MLLREVAQLIYLDDIYYLKQKASVDSATLAGQTIFFISPKFKISHKIMKNFVKILISAFFLAIIVQACSIENSHLNPIAGKEELAQQSVANAAEATSRSQPGSKIKVEVLEMSGVESGVWVCIGSNLGPCKTTSLLVSPNPLTPCG